MIICACCNPPEVEELVIVGEKPFERTIGISNGFAVPPDFPIRMVGASGRKEVSPDGVKMLEAKGCFFKEWWHQPNGNRVMGIIPLNSL